MTARILIDVDRRIVFTHAANPLTVTQVADHRARLHDDPQFDPQFGQIISFLDVRDVELSAVFAAQSRRALVVPNDLLFGLGRMFATHRDLDGESNIAIVRTLSDAADWVGIDRAVAQQAFDTLGASGRLVQ